MGDQFDEGKDGVIQARSSEVLLRAMCRIAMAHTIRHHIPSKKLYKRLNIAAVDQYYHRRLLR